MSKYTLNVATECAEYESDKLSWIQSNYEFLRDRYYEEGGANAPRYPDGRIDSDGGSVLRISHNGKIWNGAQVVLA